MKSIKTLGIATAMALALTALAGAGTASASNFEVEGAAGQESTLNGDRIGAKHSLKLGEDSFSCSNVGFAGVTQGETAASITVAPQLGCTWVAGSPATWVMNGCQFRLHPGPGSESQTVGWLDIVGCVKPMSFVNGGCQIQIGNQNHLGSVEYKNTLGGTITVIANLNSITYSRSGPCSGSSGTFSDGTYVGEWSVKALNSKSEQRSIRVNGTAAPSPSMFAAEEAPVTFSGTSVSVGYPKMFTPLGGNGLMCKSYSLSGTSASSTSAAITVTPSYKQCKVGGEVVPDSSVSTGGCSFVFHANGEFDIGGATCASNPMTFTRAGCVATVGPQSGLSAFTYTNEGSGKLRTVSISGTGESVTYTTVGPNCGVLGTFSDGKVQSPIKLTATNSSGQSQGLSVE